LHMEYLGVVSETDRDEAPLTEAAVDAQHAKRQKAR